MVEVADDGPAAGAGFLVGDVVTTIEGEPVRSMREVSRRLGPESVGRSVQVGVTRAGSPTELALTIGERRPGRRQA